MTEGGYAFFLQKSGGFEIMEARELIDSSLKTEGRNNMNAGGISVGIGIMISVLFALAFIGWLCGGGTRISEDTHRAFRNAPICPNCRGKKMIVWRRPITFEAFLRCDKCETFVRKIGHDYGGSNTVVMPKKIQYVFLALIIGAVKIVTLSALPFVLFSIFSKRLSFPEMVNYTTLAMPFVSVWFLFHILTKHEKRSPLYSELLPSDNPYYYSPVEKSETSLQKAP